MSILLVEKSLSDCKMLHVNKGNYFGVQCKSIHDFQMCYIDYVVVCSVSTYCSNFSSKTIKMPSKSSWQRHPKKIQ